MHELESPSPPRKRPRMSSPTYDQQVDLSQEDIEAFDKFEHGLSQLHSRPSSEVQRPLSPSKLKRVPQSTSLSGREKRQREIAEALRGAGSGKENRHAAEGRRERWSAPTSPSKDVVLSPQSSFIVGQDDDIENPFKVSNTNTTGNNKIPSIYPSFQRASVQQPAAGFSVPSAGFGFTNAAKLAVDPVSSSQPQSRSPSPSSPIEKDYSAWFAPLPESILPPTVNLFAPASALPLSPPQAASLFGLASALPVATHITDDTTTNDVERVHERVQSVPMMGFMKASHKAYLEPSAEALELAKEKIRVWQEHDPEPDPACTPVPQSPRRAIPGGIEESDSVESPGRMPDTPTPAGPSAPSALGLGCLPGLTTGGGAGFSTASQNFMATTAVMSSGVKHNVRPKPFKPPLLKNKAPNPTSNVAGFTGSPLNPNRPHISGTGTGTGFAPASAPHPLAGPPLTLGATTTPIRSTPSLPVGSAGFVTPMRPLLGVTSRSVNVNTNASAVRCTPAKFVTPFKAGMRPGEKGREALESAKKRKENEGEVLSSFTTVSTQQPTGNIVNSGRGNGKERWRAFDLAPPPNRQTLASSGLVPQSYDFDDLEAMGINAAELSQITPTTAMFYSFHTSSTTPLVPASLSQAPQPITLLGPSAALSQLLEKGYTLVTKPWVDNHWAMILWKLAGMVCLDPERERDGREKRWCWGEVMRQLLYRYERELNGGCRPPLRNMCTQDAPASSPMVLCVSNITWSTGGMTDDGMPIEPHPELEVTDGWYRLRAQVDESLARAVRKGVLRVGRKISVAGARLSSERKDPMEILDAYNSIQLVISGNSSHLAPWHAKLGFQMGPCISTLNHLNGDGGLVAVMAIVVVKAFPLAFIEFIEENGLKRREGPRSQNEEDQVNEKWKARREVEGSKLRTELDKKNNLLGGYADRLERRAGLRFSPAEDESAPNHIDNLYDDLDDASKAAKIIASVTANEAGWLARYIREKALRDRESAGEEVEHELQKICPPREVRNFRVLVVRDAFSNKRPSHRQAQLTVWDVLSLSHSEGSKAGSFEVGQRFMVTNLVPTQPKAWMSRDDVESEVYLSSRRDSRWTRLK